jgi:hypothetical protein
LKINALLLDLGMKDNLVRLKSGSVENYSGMGDLYNYLATYVNTGNSSYVEVFIIVLQNGSALTWIDTRNTSSSCFDPGFHKIGSQWYVNGNYTDPVSYVAHTHLYSSTASPADNSFKTLYPGLATYIYYSGSMTSY